MSDIYLAISETPTVVTLTSAVINSAVASSVTVTNTVTVALDANSLSALENVTVTVGAAITGTVTVGNSVTIGSLPAISGTVTANAGENFSNEIAEGILTFQDQDGFSISYLPAISGTVTVGNTVTIAGTVTANPTGTQTIAGTVTVGAGTAEIGTVKPAKNQSGNAQFLSVDDGSGKLFTSTLLTAGTSQIGSVTASISSFATSVTARLINPSGTSVTYAEVGTAGNPSIDVLSVQGVTAGTPLNVYPMQGTTVSNTNFTSTTASTSLVSAVTGREVLTVFNEGAGNLHISPGATATTISYQVRLSSGDYWECPAGQLSLAHSAVFATAGTARVTQVS